MRYILVMLAVFAFGLTACNETAEPSKVESVKVDNTNAVKTDEHGHSDDAPRITLADAKKDFDAGKVVFVDTRAEATFKQERIKGAINIPMENFEAKYKEIPTDKKIIAYCS
jgi:predicted sulfurtransferase